jgi:FtsP/CotA-like multicopper oxidase with cupredoxin domain
MTTTTDRFPLDTGGLPAARTPEVVELTHSQGFDVTTPGRWLAHCHIAEHRESGMMLSFDVAP